MSALRRPFLRLVFSAFMDVSGGCLILSFISTLPPVPIPRRRNSRVPGQNNALRYNWFPVGNFLGGKVFPAHVCPGRAWQDMAPNGAEGRNNADNSSG